MDETISSLLTALLEHDHALDFLPINVVLGSNSSTPTRSFVGRPHVVSVHPWNAVDNAFAERARRFASSMNYARALSTWSSHCTPQRQSGLLIIEDDVIVSADFFAAMQTRITELERASLTISNSTSFFTLNCYRPEFDACMPNPSAVDPSLLGTSRDGCCTQCRYYPAALIDQLRDAIVQRWSDAIQHGTSLLGVSRGVDPYDHLIFQHLIKSNNGHPWLYACSFPLDLAQHIGAKSTGLATFSHHSNRFTVSREHTGARKTGVEDFNELISAMQRLK